MGVPDKQKEVLFMKMKDVIAETGLTDRAIRLYIENGLVSPRFSESYTGRKNIEFSPADVKELCDIATLRKAGFSISEIKALKLDTDSCRKTLEEFMEKTAIKIESDKDILEKLQAVVLRERVTPEDICESLNGLTMEKAVPSSDTKLTAGEKFEKFFFPLLGAIGLAYIFGCILYIVLVCKFNFGYLYPTVMAFDLYFFAKLFIVLFVCASSVYLLFTYRKRKVFAERKRRLIKNALISVFSIILCTVFFFFTLSSVFTPNACSKTTSPKNYMVLDEIVYFKDAAEFFPEHIDSYATNHHGSNELLLDLPDSYPDTTKYYYKFFNTHFGGDAFMEIIAEWSPLAKYSDYDDLYDNYNECIKKYSSLESENPVLVKTNGNWRCYYYNDSSEDNFTERYFYRIFAYNDETKTLRFIYAKRDIKDPVEKAGEIIPHFPSLEW